MRSNGGSDERHFLRELRRGVSVEAMAAALYVQGLDPAQKLLLVGIANHEGDGGAWPSMERLAIYVGCSERHVRRLRAELVALGLLLVDYNAGGTVYTSGNHRTNRYRLTLPPVDKSDVGRTPTSPRQGLGRTPGSVRADMAPGVSRSRADTTMSAKPSLNHPKNIRARKSVLGPRLSPGDPARVFDLFPRSFLGHDGEVLP